jgi:hypothetical protein
VQVDQQVHLQHYQRARQGHPQIQWEARVQVEVVVAMLRVLLELRSVRQRLRR